MLRELSRAIEHIEEHLTDELYLGKISEHVGISDYHFRTVFFYLAGITLSEYTKGRRLSQADQDLLMGEKVTGIAYKYGYGSMDDFTRTFKKWSGLLSSGVVKERISKLFPKLSSVTTVKGGNTMECRIEEKPAFYLAGASKHVPIQFKGVNNAVAGLAMSITNEQREEMHALQNMEPYQIVNTPCETDADFLKEEGELTHLIGVLTTKEGVSDRLVKVPMEACVWAVFPNEGPFPFTLQDTMMRVYFEWLSTSNYEVPNVPTFSFSKTDEREKDYAYSEV